MSLNALMEIPNGPTVPSLSHLPTLVLISFPFTSHSVSMLEMFSYVRSTPLYNHVIALNAELLLCYGLCTPNNTTIVLKWIYLLSR